MSAPLAFAGLAALAYTCSPMCDPHGADWRVWPTALFLQNSTMQCAPREAFTMISFDGAVLVRSNLGGQGGRCTTTAACEEVTTAATPTEIFFRSVGVVPGGGGSAKFDLRITNESQCTRAASICVASSRARACDARCSPQASGAAAHPPLLVADTGACARAVCTVQTARGTPTKTASNGSRASRAATIRQRRSTSLASSTCSRRATRSCGRTTRIGMNTTRSFRCALPLRVPHSACRITRGDPMPPSLYQPQRCAALACSPPCPRADRSPPCPRADRSPSSSDARAGACAQLRYEMLHPNTGALMPNIGRYFYARPNIPPLVMWHSHAASIGHVPPSFGGMWQVFSDVLRLRHHRRRRGCHQPRAVYRS